MLKKYKNILGALLIISSVMISSANAEDIYFGGFVQGLYGGGLDDNNPTPSDLIASETRLQLKMESYGDGAEFFGRIDFTYDDFHEESFDVELREGFAKFRLGNNLDFKIGRQIATWGTGDLIFINDLFAKDYQSFFSGRDDQYLKAPHNALRVSYYNPLGDFTIVYSPRFTPNLIPTGERLSYFNPMMGGIVGGEPYFEGTMPDAKFENGELAGKFSRYFGTADMALYGYHGFYKNPVGMTESSAYYPELNVFGASVRMPILGGITWLEGGYYDSREDTDGDNPMIPNSSVKGMIGFERQLNSNLTVNLQYQNEYMLDHDKYVANLGPQMPKMDETYHLITSRITQMLNMETVTISAFGFYSPNEEDFYGRFSVSYKHTDELTLAIGANIFDGTYDYTDFGAFKRNDNAYIKITYGY